MKRDQKFVEKVGVGNYTVTVRCYYDTGDAGSLTEPPTAPHFEEYDILKVIDDDGNRVDKQHWETIGLEDITHYNHLTPPVPCDEEKTNNFFVYNKKDIDI